MTDRILVTGGSGLVGSYLKKYLPNAIYVSSKDYDLTTELEVKEMFLNHKPNIVIHLAAKKAVFLMFALFIENTMCNKHFTRLSALFIISV